MIGTFDQVEIIQCEKEKKITQWMLANNLKYFKETVERIVNEKGFSKHKLYDLGMLHSKKISSIFYYFHYDWKDDFYLQVMKDYSFVCDEQEKIWFEYFGEKFHEDYMRLYATLEHNFNCFKPLVERLIENKGFWMPSGDKYENASRWRALKFDNFIDYLNKRDQTKADKMLIELSYDYAFSFDENERILLKKFCELFVEDRKIFN